MIRPVILRRPWALEAGLFLVCVALPLVVVPPATLPFADAKPLFLAAGALLIWASGIPVDRRLAVPAAALGAVAVIASILGVDPLESLYGTTRPVGLVMLVPALSILAIAPAIPDELLERARVWLVRAATVAAAVALIEHLAPAVLDLVTDEHRFVGGTFGNPVVLAGFLAVGIVARFGPPPERPGIDAVSFLVFGSAFGVVSERSAYVLPVVALLAVAWLVRPDRRRLAIATAAILAGLVAFTFVPETGGDSTLDVGTQFSTTIGEEQRLAVATANLRASTERPVLGWGPSNAWSAFLSAGTTEEVRTATRAWRDTHNLVLEFAVTTGLLGLLALGWLGVRLARRVIRPPTDRAWCAAGALTLFVFSMYEPLDPTLTPMLFLSAGAAARRAPHTGKATDDPTPASVAIGSRVAVAVALGALVAVAGLSLASSIVERWGRTHAGSRWALEGARSLAPWRLTTVEALALDLALDARGGDAAAAEQARALIADAVADHPDNPGIRVLAADVEILLGDEDAARAWIDRHLERFPGDTVRIPPGRIDGETNALEP